MRNIRIFDKTLRGEEQSTGFSINLNEKLMMARQLDRLGEVSVKASSENRFVTGRVLSHDILEPSILAFLHALNKLISGKEENED